MSQPNNTAAAGKHHTGLSAGMVFLMAASCGLIAANIYYSQPLAGPIADDIGLSAGATGLIVTLTQIGYGLGLLFLVPLGDLVENRRLILVMIGISVLALLGAGLSTSPGPFLLASLLIGIGSVAVQMIVPFAAHMAHDHARGRVVGNVMSGLMLGIMLGRPVASFIARDTSWHVVFFVSAAAMVLLAATLAVRLPERRPTTSLRYGQLIASMGRLYLSEPVLRRRALYQACQFGAFSLFWTVTPLLLADVYHLTQTGIALFALAGVAGAIASPIAGRLADRELTRPATIFGMGSVAVGFLITHIAPQGSTLGLALLTLAAILLDFGITMTLVTGQRTIFGLNPALRSRLNGLYMATFFLGGAVTSALGAYAYAQGGWLEASMIGLALPVIAFAYLLTDSSHRAVAH